MSTTPTGRSATTHLLMAPTVASSERQLAGAPLATLQALTLLRWVPGFVSDLNRAGQVARSAYGT